MLSLLARLERIGKLAEKELKKEAGNALQKLLFKGKK